jgi:hypothetical protein
MYYLENIITRETFGTFFSRSLAQDIQRRRNAELPLPLFILRMDRSIRNPLKSAISGGRAVDLS